MELNSDLSSRTNGQFQNLSHLHSLGVPKKIKKATLNVWAPPSGVWEALGSGTKSLQQLVSFIDGKYPTCCRRIWTSSALKMIELWAISTFRQRYRPSGDSVQLGNAGVYDNVSGLMRITFSLFAGRLNPPPSPYYRGGLLTITPHHHCCSAENPAHIIVNADASWISLTCTRTTVSLLAFLAISVHFHTFRKRCRALL